MQLVLLWGQPTIGVSTIANVITTISLGYSTFFSYNLLGIPLLDWR